VIKRPKAKKAKKAKTERIAFTLIGRPLFRQADYVLREPQRRNPYWLHLSVKSAGSSGTSTVRPASDLR
jgi:hypothetical protein